MNYYIETGNKSPEPPEGTRVMRLATLDEIELARDVAFGDDCMEVDDNAFASESLDDDGGVWVQTWVWVPKE